mmetsp:Transcript_5834/g.12789  ORF Transcript_5834/g.12789 Transcript_5834/m.12789 type:complete len:279 (+) Transcript_5834:823-1659(+)
MAGHRGELRHDVRRHVQHRSPRRCCLDRGFHQKVQGRGDLRHGTVHSQPRQCLLRHLRSKGRERRRRRHPCRHQRLPQPVRVLHPPRGADPHRGKLGAHRRGHRGGEGHAPGEPPPPRFLDQERGRAPRRDRRLLRHRQGRAGSAVSQHHPPRGEHLQERRRTQRRRRAELGTVSPQGERGRRLLLPPRVLGSLFVSRARGVVRLGTPQLGVDDRGGDASPQRQSRALEEPVFVLAGHGGRGDVSRGEFVGDDVQRWDGELRGTVRCSGQDGFGIDGD